MKMKKLGKVSKGVEHFGLYDETGKGFTVKCTGETRVYTFNNVNFFEWFMEGQKTTMHSIHHKYDVKTYDLSMWTEVEITEATEITRYLLDIKKIK